MAKQPVEQITLYSADAPDVDPGVQNLQIITAELFQKNRLMETQRLFRIFDNRIINVTEKTPRHTKSYMVNPIILDGKPCRKRSISVSYLILSMLVGLASYGVFVMKSSGMALLESPYIYTAIVLLATLSLIFAVLAIRSVKNVWLFKTHYGKVPVIEIASNAPNRPIARGFVNHLSTIILEANNTNYFTEAQNLAAELSEHRRLRDEGIISAADYNHAKSQIMNLHSTSRQPSDTVH